MPTFDFPLFAQQHAVRDMLAELARQRAKAAVIHAGSQFFLFSHADVHGALDKTLSLVQRRRVQPFSVTGSTVSLRDSPRVRLMLAAPLYVCPKGDEVSPTPARCTTHKLKMTRA